MAKSRHPHRGSMQFWPRRRSRHSVVRVRSWASESKAKPLGFIGYKAGMTHVMARDNRAKSITKGETLALAATMIECPPMVVVGVSFYKKSLLGVRKIAHISAEKVPKELANLIQVAKKKGKTLDEISEFDDLRLVVASVPAKTSAASKKPKMIEVALGGSKEDKLAYAKEHLGSTISIEDVVEGGSCIDVHGVTKGKGFQGTVKRYGVAIKQHKGEKTKRGIGNLGAWTPKRVDFRVPQGGKMGFHLRCEYNKRVLGLGEKGEDVTPKGGITKYGVVKNRYVLVQGSVAGPRKRAVLLTGAIRKPAKFNKDAFSITRIIK